MADSRYLQKPQVGAIEDASSFSVYELARPLNFRFTVRGCNPKACASQIIHNAEVRLKYWVPVECAELPWILVVSKPSGTMSADVGMHVPSSTMSDFIDWFSARAGDCSLQNIEFAALQNGQRPKDFHFATLAALTRSTDPAIIVRQGRDRRRLVEIVSPGIRHSDSYGTVAGRRYEIAACIGKLGQRRAKARHFPIMSPFRDKAFDRLRDAWEWAECKDRRAERKRFEDEAAAISVRFPPNIDVLHDARRVAELRRLYGRDIREMKRSFDLWPSRPRKHDKSNKTGPLRIEKSLAQCLYVID